MIAQLAERSDTHQSNRPARGDLPREAVAEITASLRHLLADAFVLYLKTKNFHWHMRGPHFRDYHLLLDVATASLIENWIDQSERRIWFLSEAVQ